MAEEHRCQAPRLCVNNCGFFGSPAMQDMCSKCYRDLQMKEQQSSNFKIAISQTLTASASAPSSMISTPSVDPPVAVPSASLPGDPQARAEVAPTPAAGMAVKPNRCTACKRRVGLTGFQCRCGLTFCGTHRYPEQHACSFDFKGMGREQISKANPVVKASKLDKI